MKIKSRCPHCKEIFEVSPALIGEVTNCPHCYGRVKIAQPKTGSQLNAGTRFTFECPRCESQLEATVTMSGQAGRCPTCATDIIIPKVGRQAKIKAKADIPDSTESNPGEHNAKTTHKKKNAAEDNEESLYEIHAFAAAGISAPKIILTESGKKAISCPKCNFKNASDSHYCHHCAMPFSIEQSQSISSKSGSTARNSLIFALISLPLFMVWVFQITAIILAITALSSAKSSEKRRRYPAYIALIISILSIIIAALAIVANN